MAQQPEQGFGNLSAGDEDSFPAEEHLLHMESPKTVLDEVLTTVRMAAPDLDEEALTSVFADVVDLFKGRYPGFAACDTPYHDIVHTLDTLVAMARLLHGAHLAGQLFSGHDALLGCIAALMHDTGYIQEKSDTRKGTGARYTQEHVTRSAAFARAYLIRNQYSDQDANCCRAAILCTDLALDVNDIDFPDQTARTLGKLLGTADLLGQMAARNYLEKLLLLYRELREGRVDTFSSERDLLEKTREFYRHCKQRMAKQYGGMDAYMNLHFAQRYGLEYDPYVRYAEKNLHYLTKVLTQNGEDYRNFLKRSVKFRTHERF
ncbi:MAG: hypothetical protein QMD09_12375 [Desulfatibacillaceae bacterium]|nr:hypothetical protein [Desulfatibacillaceae bacterium]